MRGMRGKALGTVACNAMKSSGGCGKTVAILATLLKNPRKTHFSKKEDRQLPGLKTCAEFYIRSRS
jgi:hypothetical protein